MKHKSVAITGFDLLTRVFSDSDGKWREVIRWDCKQLDRLEEEIAQDNCEDPDHTAEIMLEFEQRDQRERRKIRDIWFVVSWPEHVRWPQFNSDANYGPCESEAKARAEADSVYGEPEPEAESEDDSCEE